MGNNQLSGASSAMAYSIRINQNLRPLKFTFIVSLEEIRQIQRAFELNCALWGGIQNPVITIESDPENILSLVTSSHSDYIVNLTGKPLSAEVRSVYNDYILEENRFNDFLEENREGQLSFTKALDIVPILRWYQSTLLYKFQLNTSAISAHHFLPIIESNEWAFYSTLVFGRYPEDFYVDFTKLYCDATLAQEQHVSMENLASIDPRRNITPLNITLFGIERYSQPEWSDHTTHILYLGNPMEPADWLAFWNLRAFGMDILFVPFNQVSLFAQQIHRLFEDGHYPLTQTVHNHTLIQKSPSLSKEAFKQSIEEVSPYNPAGFELHSSEVLRPFGLTNRPWKGESHGSPPLESGIVTGGQQFDTAQFIDDLLELRIINPPFASFIKSYDKRRWAVSLSSLGISPSDQWILFPYSRRLEFDLRHYRFARERFRLSPRENIVLLGESLAVNDIITINPPNTFTVFKSVLSEKGLKLTEYSEKGRYSMAIEKAMGGVLGGANLLSNPGIRAALERLAHSEEIPRLTRSNLLEVIGKNQGRINNSDYHRIFNSPENLFNDLITRKVIRPGLQFKCKECYRNSWYAVGHFSDTFECPYCFTVQQTPLLEEKEWKYSSSGMFSTKNVGYGSLPVICTSLFFESSIVDVRTIYSFNAKMPDGRDREIDLAAIRISHNERSELVLCECKTSNFCEADFTKLRNLSDLIPDAVLCIATLKPTLSDEEKLAAINIFESTAPIIVLTKNELETANVESDFLPSDLKYPRSFHSLAYATKAINLS